VQPVVSEIKKSPTLQVLSEDNSKIKSSPKTLKLTDLLKTDQKGDAKQNNAAEKIINDPFTEEQLRNAWTEYAEQRRKFQAEFQMLSQPYEVRDREIIVNLLSPVHETMLANIKVELTTFLREKLKNNFIQVSGLLTASDDKKIMYTNRDKFDYLAEKNPMLKELKDRLGLDTDF
jgi:DNA polymerase-3 subunit gamma/tau